MMTAADGWGGRRTLRDVQQRRAGVLEQEAEEGSESSPRLPLVPAVVTLRGRHLPAGRAAATSSSAAVPDDVADMTRGAACVCC